MIRLDGEMLETRFKVLVLEGFVSDNPSQVDFRNIEAEKEVKARFMRDRRDGADGPSKKEKIEE